MRTSLYQLRAFKLALILARLLPRPLLQCIAPWIGRASYARNHTAQRALRENLQAISRQSGPALEALCVRNIEHFSRMLADYFLCAAGPPGCAAALHHEWRGFEHFESARARGNGVVLVTAHLGNWELGGALLALHGLPVTVVTLEEPSTDLTRWRDRFRQKLGIHTIAVGPGHDFAFVEMIQVLRRNEILAMLVDRPYAGNGSTVTFCNRRAEFSSAPALLWQHTDAAVVPAFVLQENSGQYTSCADAPLDFVRRENARSSIPENTQRLATHFEDIIRQHPEQWFNYVPIWDFDSSSSSPSSS